MKRHPFDPVSAALGVLIVVAAACVALDRTDGFDNDTAWWIALAAILLGLTLLPWGRMRQTSATEIASRRDHGASQLPELERQTSGQG